MLPITRNTSTAGSAYLPMIAAWRRNFKGLYRHHVDYWQWLDNSGIEAVLVEEGGFHG